MSDYRRWRVAGGTFFFTLVTHSRVPIFADPVAKRILGDNFRDCQAQWPFEINALVLLPEHLHAIWTLPPGDAEYPRRWGWIKKEFTKAWLAAGGCEQPVSQARAGTRRPRSLAAAILGTHDRGRSRLRPALRLRALQSGQARSRQVSGGLGRVFISSLG